MTIIGVAWYIKEQWADFRRVSTDEVEETYEEWVANAQRSIAEIEKTGARVHKIPIDVMQLQMWCRTKGKPCDSAARSEYVVSKLKSP